ncbi:hypothetical protein [Microcoleus sp. F4-D5]|uniref:hypothetical protein n=1 Tax=Microcoleus sp. F4-D5 TaxID=2818760 RepID=UPI002FD415A7
MFGDGNIILVGWGQVYEIVGFRHLLSVNPPLQDLCLVMEILPTFRRYSIELNFKEIQNYQTLK